MFRSKITFNKYIYSRILRKFSKKEFNTDKKFIKEMLENFSLEKIKNQPESVSPEHPHNFNTHRYLQVYEADKSLDKRFNTKFLQSIYLLAPSSAIGLDYYFSSTLEPLSLLINLTFLAIGIILSKRTEVIRSMEVKSVFISKNYEEIILGFERNNTTVKFCRDTDEICENLTEKNIKGNLKTNYIYYKISPENLVFLGWSDVVDYLRDGLDYGKALEIQNENIQKIEKSNEKIEDFKNSFGKNSKTNFRSFPNISYVVYDEKLKDFIFFEQINKINKDFTYFDYLDKICEEKKIDFLNNNLNN